MLELLEEHTCYVPHAAVAGFLGAAARAAGEPNLGVLIAPMMNAANYGSFGDYVLGADNLEQSLERAVNALRYHSTGDRMSVSVRGETLRYSYFFALSGRSGYDIVAPAAAGVLLSVLRAYLPHNWRPLHIQLNIGKPPQAGLFEEVFRCPVHFNATAVTIVTERQNLFAASRRGAQSLVTIEDVKRERGGEAPLDVQDIIIQQIHAQLLGGDISLDRVAQSMDTSVRTLQRELNRLGTNFRTLTNAVRIRRAAELLEHTNGSITTVSAEMGYSSPANFARAFKKITGVQPKRFRS